MQTVQLNTIKGTQGLNNITIDNLLKLTEGVYVLKVTGTGVTLHQKINKGFQIIKN